MIGFNCESLHSKPGTYAIKSSCNAARILNTTDDCVSANKNKDRSRLDVALDFGRNIIPDNIVASTFEMTMTDTIIDDNGVVSKTKTIIKSVNILGNGFIHNFLFSDHK